jgi:hypothetical protein
MEGKRGSGLRKVVKFNREGNGRRPFVPKSETLGKSEIKRNDTRGDLKILNQKSKSRKIHYS